MVSGAESVIAFDQIATAQVATNVFANWAANGLSGDDAAFDADQTMMVYQMV